MRCRLAEIVHLFRPSKVTYEVKATLEVRSALWHHHRPAASPGGHTTAILGVRKRYDAKVQIWSVLSDRGELPVAGALHGNLAGVEWSQRLRTKGRREALNGLDIILFGIAEHPLHRFDDLGIVDGYLAGLLVPEFPVPGPAPGIDPVALRVPGDKAGGDHTRAIHLVHRFGQLVELGDVHRHVLRIIARSRDQVLVIVDRAVVRVIGQGPQFIFPACGLFPGKGIVVVFLDAGHFGEVGQIRQRILGCPGRNDKAVKVGRIWWVASGDRRQQRLRHLRASGGRLEGDRELDVRILFPETVARHSLGLAVDGLRAADVPVGHLGLFRRGRLGRRGLGSLSLGSRGRLGGAGREHSHASGESTHLEQVTTTDFLFEHFAKLLLLESVVILHLSLETRSSLCL